MQLQEGEIRIYVACLAAYNNGYLHGRWINADQEASEIQAAIAEMLKASPMPEAEEWSIHDHEGFEGIQLSEYTGIEQVAELAAFIAEHGELGGKLHAYFGDLDAAREALEDHYAGEYRSVAEFAEDITAETTSIPENLSYYIDWERMARDLEISDILTIETGFECVHVFWQH